MTDKIQLSLSENEAITLSMILLAVSGSSANSRRKHADSMIVQLTPLLAERGWSNEDIFQIYDTVVANGADIRFK